MTAKEIKTNKGEAPEVVAKRQAAYRQKQMKEGLVRAQLWVTPEEKTYLNIKLETLRKSKLTRDNAKDNQLTRDIFSGSFNNYKKKWPKRNSDKYYSNAFFNTGEYSYGQIKAIIPSKLADGVLVFRLKNTKSYPIIRLRGLGDPTVICAILHCLHGWYMDSQHQFDRRKKILNLKLHDLGEDIKRQVYKAKASISMNLSDTPFAFLMQPILVESGTVNADDIEVLYPDQLLIYVDDDFRIIQCSDRSFNFEDILRWPRSLVEPLVDNSLKDQASRHLLMTSLVGLFMTGIEDEIPVLYLNRLISSRS